MARFNSQKATKSMCRLEKIAKNDYYQAMVKSVVHSNEIKALLKMP